MPSSARPMADKRTTEAEVVEELRDGMTVGIGGWGSRRKPMSIIREILRSPVRDLTIVSYGGPARGVLCAGGKAKKVVFGLSPPCAIPPAPPFPAAPPSSAPAAPEVAVGAPRRGARG